MVLRSSQRELELTTCTMLWRLVLVLVQDLSSVTASESCKIIKMKPPRKGDHNQATLEESFGAGAS